MAIDPTNIRLDGAVAIVTGGGTGIGRGIAEGLHAFGARVAIWERDLDLMEEATAAINGLGVHVDVRDTDAVDRAMGETTAAMGSIGILVNNAGGTFAKPLLDMSDNGFDALYRANLKHVLTCTQRVGRHMIDAGVAGSIINITSIEGVRAAPNFAAYAAAKAGVINLTKTAALELAPHHIRVNALAPDITLTEGLAELAGPDAHTRWSRIVPLGRAGRVDEMAGAAVFLASSMSSYVTGQTIHVDGGTHAAGGWYRREDGAGYTYGPSS